MELFKSKKFQMAVAGVVVVIVTQYIPEIDEVALTQIVALIVAAIIGQGMADFKKEANK